MKLSERARLRRRAGLTQHRLAKLTGICASTISLWENAEIHLPPEAVAKIGRALTTELNRAHAVSTNEVLYGPAPTMARAGHDLSNDLSRPRQ